MLNSYDVKIANMSKFGTFCTDRIGTAANSQLYNYGDITVE